MQTNHDTADPRKCTLKIYKDHVKIYDDSSKKYKCCVWKNIPGKKQPNHAFFKWTLSNPPHVTTGWHSNRPGPATVATDPSEISDKCLQMLKRLRGTENDQTLCFYTVCMIMVFIYYIEKKCIITGEKQRHGCIFFSVGKCLIKWREPLPWATGRMETLLHYVTQDQALRLS